MTASSKQKNLVIISGGGTGIGRACAQRLSQWAGTPTSVLVIGRNEKNLFDTLSLLPAGNFKAVCDLSSTSSIENLKKTIAAIGLPISGLINNAGIIERKLFVETDETHWRKQFEVNFFGAVSLTRLILPFMIKEKQGHVINISSTLGARPITATTAYSASKAALINWTKGLAIEMSPHNIRVNCICPGIVETPIWEIFGKKDSESEKTRKILSEAQPLKRMGTPEEIAQAVSYFFESTWTTGAILDVDGGINL